MAKHRGDEQQSTSLFAIQILVFVLVNFVLWGIAAGLYNSTRGIRSARGVVGNIVIFVVSALVTLPEIGSVIPYIWGNHKWYVGVFLVMEILLILFIWWMKSVDDDLKGGNPFRRR